MWPCDPVLTSTVLDSYHWAGPLFVSTLQALLAAQCALVGDHVWPKDAFDDVIKDPNYDFIVVGAGSAGAVVANRLSEVPDWKVLLIEAGGNPTMTTETPQSCLMNLNTAIDWGYHTQPQDACRSYKTKGCSWPRGKVLGGSSSINGLYYVRGNKLDYDEWAAEGNEGWSYKDVLPYFKKSENLTDFSNTLKKEQYHGTDGYLSVETSDDTNPLEAILLTANSEVGLKILEDINGDEQMGTTKSMFTAKNGVRHSTARAYLNPVKERSNLHILKNAHVTKLLFKPGQKEVNGVIVNKNGEEIIINAKKEIILSAGVLNTPQILMLSGIGPKKHLQDLNIDIKADLPVGENLQDHLFVPVLYKMKGMEDLVNLPNILGAVGAFLFHKAGPMSSLTPHRVIGFFNTTDPNSLSPDIQQHFIILFPNQSHIIDYYQKHGTTDEVNDQINQINKENFLINVPTVLLKPKSKGKVMLHSKNPFDKPLIYANYFENHEDMQTLINGLRFNMKLADTKAFRDNGIEPFWLDIDTCNDLKTGTDAHLECWAREITFSLYHPVGTAKMGLKSDPTTVVDSSLKVHGFKNLRVIDASIMPHITRGNTNAAVIMIGEKGSDFIKTEWKVKHSEL